MNKENYKHVAVVAVSGTGKGTVSRSIRQIILELQVPVSATTRKPRAGEENGVHYHFYSWWKFILGILTGKFLEWNYYNGNLYGTLYSEITNRDIPLFFDVDINGAVKLRKHLGKQILLVFLDCPIEESEKRLRGREKGKPESFFRSRMKIGKKEILRKNECDEIVWYGPGSDPNLKANEIANLMLIK